jgi:hypothetical protein
MIRVAEDYFKLTKGQYVFTRFIHTLILLVVHFDNVRENRSISFVTRYYGYSRSVMRPQHNRARMPYNSTVCLGHPIYHRLQHHVTKQTMYHMDYCLTVW